MRKKKLKKSVKIRNFLFSVYKKSPKIPGNTKSFPWIFRIFREFPGIPRESTLILTVTHCWKNEWMTKCTMILSKKSEENDWKHVLPLTKINCSFYEQKKNNPDWCTALLFLGPGHWGRPPCSIKHSSGSQSTSQCQLAKRRNRRDVRRRWANVTVGKWQSEYCQFTIEWFRNVDGDCRKWIRTSRKKTNRAECTSQ